MPLESTYGDHAQLPKREDTIGKPLSPYAVTKYLNDLYAGVYAQCYGMETIGLRYLNVFGARQDPAGAYAAVIPRWASEMLGARRCVINGDGETSRDFCYIANVVQANLLAATTTNPAAINQVYNTPSASLLDAERAPCPIAAAIGSKDLGYRSSARCMAIFRAGDVRHSLADIDKARQLIDTLPRTAYAAACSRPSAAASRRFARRRVSAMSPKHLGNSRVSVVISTDRSQWLRSWKARLRGGTAGARAR